MQGRNIKKILIVENSMRYKRLLLRFFSKKFPAAKIEEFNPKHGCPDNTFPWEQFNLLVLNFALGKNGNGLDWLKINRINNNFPATIFITDHDDIKIATQALRYGAHDYLSKTNLSIAELNSAVDCAISKHANEINIKRYAELLSHKLLNRVELYQKLDDITGSGILLLVSIDNFNDIRYQIGLIVADEFASHLANIIITCSASIKTSDIEIIRMTDHIIAILILGNSNDIHTKLAEKICKQATTTNFAYEEQKISYRISIGITHFSENFHGAHNIIAHADIALQFAMNKQENSFLVFGKDMKNTGSLDKKMVDRVISLIKKDRLQPFFQPIIDVSGCEKTFNAKLYQIRIKLADTDGKLLQYEDFFPILEQSNMVKHVDYCVIQRVIKILHKMKNNDQQDVGFLISLERQTLCDTNLIKWVEKFNTTLKASDLISSIIFEIRSEYFLANQKNILNTILRLRDSYGISFSLTHVCGLSALDTCMTNSLFEFVKIPIYQTLNSVDQMIQKNELTRLIIHAKEFGAMVIIDKIDHDQYLASAIECNTDFVSGFLIQPPQKEIPLEQEITL